MRLPVESFVADVPRPQGAVRAPLDPAKVRALGLMISDKQAGPFELLVDRIAVER